MWGVPAEAHFWNKEPYKKSSHKWHLVNEASLEQKPLTVTGWKPENVKTFIVWYGVLACGGNEHPWLREPTEWEAKSGYYSKKLNAQGLVDERGPLVIKETLKISQANICAYCKKAAMKKLSLENVEI